MASIILGVGLGCCSLSQAQVGGAGGGISGGMPIVPGTAFGGATDPSSIRPGDGLRLVPSIQISEHYDSNVFSAPKDLLQGQTPEDVVTTVSPQVRGLYTDHEHLVKLNAVVGAVGSYYVNNTGLSYVGANVGAILDMSDWLSRWRPGSRWTVSDTFFYSPQPPTFLIGGQSGEQANPLVAGFQAFRTNTSSNSVNTLFELPLSMTVKLTGSYTNSFIDYGTSEVLQATSLISQRAQVYTAGLATQVSMYDTVRVDYTGNEFDQGRLGTFSARGGTLGWTHRFTPTISLNMSGGAQLVSGKLAEKPFSAKISPFGSLAIHWKDPTTFIAITYRSSITPSFQFQGAALLNHIVSCNIAQNTPIRHLVGLVGAYYSLANEYGSNSGNAISWNTVSGTAGLQYRATQKLYLTLTYSYQNVDNAFEGMRFAYDRHVAQLNLSQAFY